MKRILLSVFAAAVTVAWTVPASADVTFNGEYRARGEWRDNADIGATPDDAKNDTQSFIGQRVRLTANAQATDDVSFKITLQDTRNWGTASAPNGGPNLTDNGIDNHLDLHESYINISNFLDTPVSLRIGRQELNYGDQRLIGSFGWSNNGRSFDAIKAMVTTDLANVDVFWSKVVDRNTAAGSPDNDQDLYGIYATTNVVPNNTLDLYALLARDGGLAGGTFTTNLYTVGARLAGSVAGLDYTVEFPYQFGDLENNVIDLDIKAWALAAKVGYTVPGAPMNLRLGAEYNYATGDDDAADSDIETFTNLAPTNHDKLGFMDLQAWRNVSAWSLNAAADVTEKVRVYVAYWDLRRAEGDDAWYQAGQWNFGGTATADTDKEIGSEIDLVANYKYNNNVTIEAGLARFFAGDALGSGADDQDWAYLQITGRF